MSRLFREIAGYFGVLEQWRVVFVQDNGARRCVGTVWTEKVAQAEAADLNDRAKAEAELLGIWAHGHFTTEKVT